MMMNKESTYGLELNQLAGLFSLGLGELGLGSQELYPDGAQLANLLQRQLDETLPEGGAFLFESLLAMKGALSCDVRDLQDKSLGALLTDKKTDLVLLKAINASSKRTSKELVSDAALAIATAIYYGALASALVHHQEKITQHSFKSLEQSFRSLAGKKWMDARLKQLFGSAREVCLEKQE